MKLLIKFMFNLKNLYLIFLINFFLSKSINEKMINKNFLKFEIDSDGNKWKLDEEEFIDFNFYKKDYEKFINSKYFYMKNENNNINILRDWSFKSVSVFNNFIYDWFSFLEKNENDLLKKGYGEFIDISWEKSKDGYIENKFYFFIKNFESKLFRKYKKKFWINNFFLKLFPKNENDK